MGRWKPGAQGRLEEAAMELFEERGFEETTVADIAARADLTKRTFFRYFADKREVLFAGSAALKGAFVEAIAAAPADAGPLDAVAHGLDAMAGFFGKAGEHPRKRQAIITANPDLQERELVKMVGFAAAGAEALRVRGVKDPAATLAAEAGIAVLRVAFEEWAGGPAGKDLGTLLDQGMAELRAVAAA
jgi:AcrR family transcriptional regulator